jgi:DNA-binding FadR family transcriptional regulator
VRIPPRVAQVAGDVRTMIDDGTLRPGDPAPTGAALREITGAGLTQCLMALRLLEADGTLVRRTFPLPRGVVRVVREPAQSPRPANVPSRWRFGG